MSEYTQLKELVEDLGNDFLKFHEKNVKKSGTRLRKSLMDIKKLVDKMRKDVLQKIKIENELTTRKMIIVDKPEDSDENTKYHLMSKSDFKEEKKEEDVKKKFRKPRKREPKKK